MKMTPQLYIVRCPAVYAVSLFQRQATSTTPIYITLSAQFSVGLTSQYLQVVYRTADAKCRDKNIKYR